MAASARPSSTSRARRRRGRRGTAGRCPPTCARSCCTRSPRSPIGVTRACPRWRRTCAASVPASRSARGRRARPTTHVRGCGATGRSGCWPGCSGSARWSAASRCGCSTARVAGRLRTRVRRRRLQRIRGTDDDPRLPGGPRLPARHDAAEHHHGCRLRCRTGSAIQHDERSRRRRFVSCIASCVVGHGRVSRDRFPTARRC